MSINFNINFNILYNRENLLAFTNENTNYGTKIIINNLLTHEIVHQWIGNIITHEWWNDIWLIEGMTKYLEFIGIDGVNPHLQKMDDFGIEAMYYCFRNDIINNGFFKLNKEIRDDIPLSLGKVFPAHVYLKGATVIRMCANILTAPDFQAVIQNIIKKLYAHIHKYKCLIY